VRDSGDQSVAENAAVRRTDPFYEGRFRERQATNFVAPSPWLISASPRLVNGQNPGAILRALSIGLCTKSQKNRVWTRKIAFQKAINY
jgi:hypothetical protein